MDDALEPLAEDFQRVLVMVAHPDDIEYGGSAAVARWTSAGKDVRYVLATSGEAGIDTMDPAECGVVREAEQRAAAAAVGVEQVEFLGLTDGVIEYDLPTRRIVAAAVRRHRPDVVVTGNFHDTWGPGAYNQADHIAWGRAVLDGRRDAGNRWIFRDLLDEGLEPVPVPRLLVANSPLAAHAIDVGDHTDAGIASLEAHRAYLDGLGDNAMADPEEFLESIWRQTGARLGVVHAVAFEVIG